MEQSIAVRFLRKVEQTPNCWIWKGYTHKNGYGLFRFSGGTSWAHRVAYSLFCGPIPDGLCVCHRCDVRSCVNPAHLFIGTHKQNMQDCLNKGRYNSPSGEKHHGAKLTKSDVSKIRRKYSRGMVTQRELAAKYGVSRQEISLVVNNLVWVN